MIYYKKNIIFEKQLINWLCVLNKSQKNIQSSFFRKLFQSIQFSNSCGKSFAKVCLWTFSQKKVQQLFFSLFVFPFSVGGVTYTAQLLNSLAKVLWVLCRHTDTHTAKQRKNWAKQNFEHDKVRSAQSRQLVKTWRIFFDIDRGKKLFGNGLCPLVSVAKVSGSECLWISVCVSLNWEGVDGYSEMKENSTKKNIFWIIVYVR